MDNYLPENEVKSLPSKKLQYPEAVRVYHRPYTFGDLVKINNSNFNTIQLFNFILEGIKVTGMDKLDLTFYDVVYIGWLRKIASLGTPIFNIRAYCPNCDFKNSRTMELKDMDFEDTEVPRLPIRTKIGGKELEFKFLTMRAYLDLVSSGRSEDIIALFSNHVVNMSNTEAYDLIYNSVGMDMSKIDKLNKLLYHGLQPIQFKCAECEHVYGVNPSNQTEAEVVKPFRGESDVDGDEISFG